MRAFTIRLPDDVTDQLDALAVRLDRSRAYLSARAIREYVAREIAHHDEIAAGLAEAESGEFASDAEVAEVMARYVTPRAKP